LKSLEFLGEIPKPNPKMADLTQPNPGQKFLTQTHHYNIKLYKSVHKKRNFQRQIFKNWRLIIED